MEEGEERPSHRSNPGEGNNHQREKIRQKERANCLRRRNGTKKERERGEKQVA